MANTNVRLGTNSITIDIAGDYREVGHLIFCLPKTTGPTGPTGSTDTIINPAFAFSANNQNDNIPINRTNKYHRVLQFVDVGGVININSTGSIIIKRGYVMLHIMM